MKVIRNTGAAGRLLSVVGLSLLISGCDYWPPALQAQIEQLRSEVQTLTVEKAQLQSQINELARGKQDLQTQFDDLSRVSREKTSVIAGLQNQLDAMRAKMAKAPVAKSAAKSTPKAPAKKKATTTKKR
jgi:outer membrane murein-binding lipoprotein Lpp